MTAPTSSASSCPAVAPARRLLRAATCAVVAAGAALTLGGCGAFVGVGPAPTASVGGVLGAERAQATATRVVDQARRAAATPGPEGDALRAEAFTGDALVAARADARLAAVTSAATTAQQALVDTPPVVLAVGRDLTYPRTMVVQSSLKASGLPVLMLLTTPDARTAYRIAARVSMLPGAQVPGFDPLAAGSPALAPADASSAGRYGKLVEGYAGSLAYPSSPRSVAPGITAGDAFSTAVRSNAARQAASIASLGSFRQQHEARAVTGGLATAGGRSALVFGVIDRSDTALVKNGTLTITKAFTALSGLASVTSEADLSTLEVVALVVPASGDATVVGGEEHLYAAQGA